SVPTGSIVGLKKLWRSSCNASAFCCSLSTSGRGASFPHASRLVAAAPTPSQVSVVFIRVLSPPGGGRFSRTGRWRYSSAGRVTPHRTLRAERRFFVGLQKKAAWQLPIQHPRAEQGATRLPPLCVAGYGDS